MNDLDHMLAKLRTAPVGAAMDDLDVAVMAGLAAGRERRTARTALGLACGVATIVGLWGGLSVPRTAHSAGQPLMALPAAAPSHLLAS